MFKRMKTYQIFFLAVALFIWSAFSYTAHSNQYVEGRYHEATVIDSIFDPNEETDHMAAFTFKDTNVIIVKPVEKDVFTAFHGNGQIPLDVSILISEQELQFPPSKMIMISKYVCVAAASIALLCFIIMIFTRKKKETSEEKRQKLKSRV
jgi:hypothetical protein